MYKLSKEVQFSLRSLPSSDVIASKCLIRFHNCTPYSISIFWLDFLGQPQLFCNLASGKFTNIDTFKDHYWMFGANLNLNSKKQKAHETKIIAIPEDQIKINDHLAKYKTSEGDIYSITEFANNICALCSSYSRYGLDIPTSDQSCAHLVGTAKFAANNLLLETRNGFLNSSYSYRCDNFNHKTCHQDTRRNVFLVEPFYSLLERCLLKVDHNTITDSKIPLNLKKQFIEFRVRIYHSSHEN